MKKAERWSQKAINEFEKLLNAETLIFNYDCHALTGHLYGSLEAVSYSGQSLNMNDLLKDVEEALDATNFARGKQSLHYSF